MLALETSVQNLQIRFLQNVRKRLFYLHFYIGKNWRGLPWNWSQETLIEDLRLRCEVWRCDAWTLLWRVWRFGLEWGNEIRDEICCWRSLTIRLILTIFASCDEELFHEFVAFENSFHIQLSCMKLFNLLANLLSQLLIMTHFLRAFHFQMPEKFKFLNS